MELMNMDRGPECSPKCTELATTLKDRLEYRKSKLESELYDVNAAIDAMNKNPEVANVINLVSRVSGRL